MPPKKKKPTTDGKVLASMNFSATGYEQDVSIVSKAVDNVNIEVDESPGAAFSFDDLGGLGDPASMLDMQMPPEELMEMSMAEAEEERIRAEEERKRVEREAEEARREAEEHKQRQKEFDAEDYGGFVRRSTRRQKPIKKKLSNDSDDSDEDSEEQDEDSDSEDEDDDDDFRDDDAADSDEFVVDDDEDDYYGSGAGQPIKKRKTSYSDQGGRKSTRGGSKKGTGKNAKGKGGKKGKSSSSSSSSSSSALDDPSSFATQSRVVGGIAMSAPDSTRDAIDIEQTKVVDLGPGERSRWKKFASDIHMMMYGFGDVPNPLPESVSLMEDIALDYMRDLTMKAYNVGKKRRRFQFEDALFVLRKDGKKDRRARQLLVLNEEIKKTRKLYEYDEKSLKKDEGK
eukprot:TRINITY_DN5401_c0_g5_i1.p1 TRINITY_DN5401_c0_g5~~TRINITY_DN5401_c0_g5_i1.p1  ORF type:complete len:409 (+),score=161.64 TRINITY_DN5401_c0_g5_i1:35-1228(+)